MILADSWVVGDRVRLVGKLDHRPNGTRGTVKSLNVYSILVYWDSDHRAFWYSRPLHGSLVIERLNVVDLIGEERIV